MADIEFKVVDFGVYNVNKCYVPTDEELEDTANALADAIRANGLVHLTNTGLCEDKLRKAWKACDTFLGLPINQKEPYNTIHDYINGVKTPVYKKPGYNGYYSHEPDNSEAMNFWLRVDKIPFPEEEVPGITAAMKPLAEESLTLLKNVLECLALGLDLGRDAFGYTVQAIKDEKLNLNATLMRLNYYKPKRDVEAMGLLEKRFGPHRDLTLLTLVRPDKKGLQMRTKAGEWIDVPIIPGTCIVQVGIVMAYILGIEAPYHQVVFTGEESDQTERRSTVLFLRPDNECRIVPVPGAPNQSSKSLNDFSLKLDL